MKFAAAPLYTTTEVRYAHHAQELNDKPLCSKFFCQQAAIPQVDLEGSHYWLGCPQLRCKTEAFICAAQEQIVVTNLIRKDIFKQNVNPMCRLCNEYN
eukprot:9012826-Ditylum_brightwellii.AAC.1